MSASIQSIRVNPRYDLQSAFVLISYEQTQSINGVTWMQPVTDQYPALLPTDPLSFFNGLRFTVDLQGVNATTTQATLVCGEIKPTDLNWWLARQPQYEPHDLGAAAEDGNAIASIAFDFTTLERQPTNTGETDKGWQNELQDGELTDWMTAFKSQRITFTVKATITMRDGSIEPNHTLSYQLNSTNANSGTFKNTQVSQYAEPLPIGLAQQLYNAVSVLQFEGEIVLEEEDCSGLMGIGQLFNLTGGANALAEWSTMNGMVQRITENLDAGTTTVEFGPPRFISAGELVDLLRVNRFRKLSYSVGLALGQTGGGQTGVPLGKNTSEKNSASTPGFSQQHVVSGTIDGTGANVTSAAGFTQWTPSGPVNPVAAYPAGSITINLADSGGQTLKIQKLPICQDGVPGSIYVLCSTFVPDP